MKNENPNYYSVLPANIRYDNSLTNLEKLLYSEISSLCNHEGYCWASNNYFGRLYNRGEKWISKSINKLAKKGYITISVDKKFIRKIYIINNNQNQVEEKKPKRTNKELPKIYLDLADLLYSEIKKNHDKLNIKYNQKTWGDIFRKLIEIDKYNEKTIKEVIYFSQEDKFWKKNILSASKFRQKFNTLLAQMPEDYKKPLDINEKKMYYQDNEVFLEIEKITRRDTVFISHKYYYLNGNKKIYIDKNKIIKK